MRKWKKPTTSLLAVALSFTVLAGCGGKADEPAGSGQGVEGNGAADDKPVSLTFYVRPINNKYLKSYKDIAAFQEIEKKTNTNVSWQEPSAGDTSQQFNIMLASGSYPDMIYWGTDGYPGGLSKLLQDEVAVKLNDLIDSHAPNFKALLDSNPELKKQIMLDDGTIALLPKIELDLQRNAYTGFQIRKDWLDQVGMGVPTTIDEWYAVLKAFKEKDLNGNGEADEIPLGEQKGMESIRNFAAAWGVRTGLYLDPNSQKIEYGPLQPAFKAYMETMHQWFEEGLIEPEFASLDGKAFDAKFTNNQYGAMTGYMSWFDKFNNLMKGENPDFKLVAAPDPIGPGGKPYSNNDGLIRYVSGEGAFITSQNKNPEHSVKFLDFMYGQEGSDLLNWGVEGESYQVDNGNKKYTDQVLNNSEGLTSVDYMLRYAIPIYGFTKIMDREAWAQLSLTADEAKEANEIWYQSDKSLLLPNLTLTAEESQQYSQIMSEVNTYFDEMFIKFIMGVEPLEKFDGFISTLKKMGIEEAVQIQQAAYDRFQARK
ncbi:extracellular solute-binding protein [Paenibacillus sp. J2TS4]|uniref:extracellular solute-binding protein n=1 Tax=Paenibacillus sp. J2TS4 TaxID=2807194 RepID=UPI001B21B3C0|nr:extracellular solute-binding protein [Paenibacillus sp. J2TS4]GIP34886.1 ABC transporter substrate-binding protein [Paenibacillus sp. J2TS4]